VQSRAGKEDDAVIDGAAHIDGQAAQRNNGAAARLDDDPGTAGGSVDESLHSVGDDADRLDDVSGQKLPGVRTLIDPLSLVWSCANLNVRHGAVLGQFPASVPVPETQVSFAAWASVALASMTQPAAKEPIPHG
jgi:hypothetical protein